MSKTIYEINKDLNATSFENWDIGYIFLNIDKNSSDPLTRVIGKYVDYGYKDCSITYEDAIAISKSKNEEEHILIKIYKDCLLSCNSSTYKESNLLNDTINFIQVYFKNYKNGNGLVFNSLIFAIKWLIYKYKMEKEQISSILINHINSMTEINSLTFDIISYSSNENRINIFSESQIKSVYDKYFVNVGIELQKNFNFYAQSYFDFIKKLFQNKDNIRLAKKEFCDFALRHIKVIDYLWGQKNLPIIRDYMDELNYSDECYEIIDEKIDSCGKEAISHLEEIELKMPDEQNKKISENIKNNTDILLQKTNPEKIVILLLNLPLISKSNISNDIIEKNIFSSLCQYRIMDEDGKIINYKELNDDEKFSLYSTKYFEINVNLFFDLLINPFFSSFVFDSETSKFLDKILTNNKIVPVDRFEGLKSKISLFLNKDFASSVFPIIGCLEPLLRYYFKNERMNTKKRNQSGDSIGLSDIFSYKKANLYREKLLETIDEDFYFSLEWLLVDKYGYGLRHKIAHGLIKEDKFLSYLSIYAVLLIIKLIIGFSS
jgi:hypothetical protein